MLRFTKNVVLVSFGLVFGTIYSGMAFVSTLFHLPTAEAFDRKRSELSSLHTLGKLITQVFDFNELVDTVTTMTLDVCKGQESWLELVSVNPEQTAGDDGMAHLPVVQADAPVQVQARRPA